MNIALVLLLAAGLSMDAFAVSITNGMCYRMPVIKNAIYSGLAFGIFQGLMPLIGYLAGASFSQVVEKYDHWIALFLLGFIGIRMVLEAVKDIRNPNESDGEKAFSFKFLIVQAVATSIDALAVGVSLGVMKIGVIFAVTTIAVITFAMSFAGVFIGKRFGGLLKEKAAIAGGIILIIIGINIFLEHTGILG